MREQAEQTKDLAVGRGEFQSRRLNGDSAPAGGCFYRHSSALLAVKGRTKPFSKDPDAVLEITYIALRLMRDSH